MGPVPHASEKRSMPHAASPARAARARSGAATMGGGQRIDRALRRGLRPGPPQAAKRALPEHVDAPVEPQIVSGCPGPADDAGQLVDDVVLLDVELDALAPGERDPEELVGQQRPRRPVVEAASDRVLERVVAEREPALRVAADVALAPPHR